MLLSIEDITTTILKYQINHKLIELGLIKRNCQKKIKKNINIHSVKQQISRVGIIMINTIAENLSFLRSIICDEFCCRVKKAAENVQVRYFGQERYAFTYFQKFTMKCSLLWVPQYAPDCKPSWRGVWTSFFSSKSIYTFQIDISNDLSYIYRTKFSFDRKTWCITD
jgi:hypothetical protein